MTRSKANTRTKARAAVTAPGEDVEFDGEVREHGQPGLSLLAKLKLVLGGLLLVGLVGGLCFVAYRFAITTPRFAVQELKLQGSRRMSEASVLRLAGVAPGQNIFTVDLALAEQKLVEDPWIAQAHISRELPNTLSAVVVEREAVALAAIADELFLLTAEGEPFLRLDGSEAFDLPLITGLGALNFAEDRPRERERGRTAVEVLREYQRLDVARVHSPQEVHLRDDGSVTLVVGSRGVSLELGKGPWRQKLLMAMRVLGRVSAQGELPEVVFLDNEEHPERVVVRMR